ncbi:MAG: recombination protein RecR [Cytophagia bacterium]|nr:MAG: recombination protein RecR [Cytophagia bacterium]TAG46322.1 MAG: recombination protein RecR [Cytophagia bacterium]
MEFSSKLIENAVKEIAKLPSIGQKTALRLVLHLLKQDEFYTNTLTDALKKLRTEIQYCQNCHNISDSSICNICSNPQREQSLVCVVENMQDIIAIENTHQYRGLYHVLGGVISPMNGISPSDLNIETLINRLPNSPIKEIIFALSPTMEGDTTAFYLTRKIKPLGIKLSTIARGIAIGSELEYADEITLGRSILGRINYE